MTPKEAQLLEILRKDRVSVATATKLSQMKWCRWSQSIEQQVSKAEDAARSDIFIDSQKQGGNGFTAAYMQKNQRLAHC